MYVCMYVWMYVCMDEWMDRIVNYRESLVWDRPTLGCWRK